MTAKQTALKDISNDLHREHLKDNRERFFLTEGKNPTYDVWTLRKTHLINWKHYNFGITL